MRSLTANMTWLAGTMRALVLIHDREADSFDPVQFEAIEEGATPLRLTLRRDAKGNWASAA